MELYRNECTYTQFDEACSKYPTNTAIIYLGERISYARLHELVDRFAVGLLNSGVKIKEKVMLFIPNCPQWIIANFAINKIGGAVVPVSPIYTSYEIEYIINDAEVETVICLDTNYMYVNEVLGKTNLKRIIVTNLVDLIPCWKRFVGNMLDLLHVAADDEDFEAVMGIEMHMKGGDDLIVVRMLLLGQLLRKVAHMVVIHQSDSTHRILIFRSQSLLHQRCPDQVAYCLRAVHIALLLDKLIKTFQQFLIK